MYSFKTKKLLVDKLPDFCEIPLYTAEARQFILPEGRIVIQSIPHYLGKIQLIDISIDESINIDLPLDNSSFFLYADLYQNSCFISYRPAEQYHKIITKGQHRLLLIHFNTEWFKQKCQKLPELKGLITGSIYRPELPVTLPAYGISERIFNLLKKTNAKTNELNQDKNLFLFIDDCVNRYYRKLASKHITLLHHQHKASAIAKFVAENYASTLVEDLPYLAARFMISERHLARIAKMTFGIPLHSQVIKIRLHNGLYHLMTTDKPIYEISQMIGYREPYYFSKAFKKQFGVPPCGWKNSKILPSD